MDEPENKELEQPEDSYSGHASVGSLMESRTSHLDDALSQRLVEALHATTQDVHLHDLVKIAIEHHPIDLAYAASRLPPSARPLLYANLPDLSAKVIFMINTDRTTRVHVFRHMLDEELRELIERMPADEAVRLIDDLAERRIRRLIDHLEPKKVAQMRELQKHKRNTAGAMMTSEFFAFTPDKSISEVASYIRDHPGIDLTRRIFVVDEQGILEGYVPARNLIVNHPKLFLRQVMRFVDHQLTPEATREEVVDIVERYKIAALPIVDADNRLVGVITFEDVVEEIEDIADETIAWMAGTAEDVSEHDHIVKRFLARAPWLLVTLCAGLISATIMSYYQGVKAEVLAFIVFFVPLITGMSGNVGIQCSTLLVRGMAIGMLTAGNRRAVMLKEAALGLMTGTIFGSLCGFIVYFLNASGTQVFSANPLELGVTVAMGVLGACLSATFLGVSAPFFFARLGIDPALASGPIVTACNDMLSIIIFFVISGLIAALFF